MAQPLSHLTDPIALGKLQILLVPVHGTSSPRQTIPDSIYLHWSDSIRRHASIRSDELIRPDIAPSHVRGGPSSSPRSRFFPSNTASSVSRANVNQHVHLAYPSHPPAKHLFPLSLLRMTAFPLVVIGIGVAPGHDEGYTVDGEGGDIGEASTPRQSKFPPHQSNVDPMAALEDTLAGLLPPSSAYPLVKRLVLVPPTTPDSPHVYTSPRKAANGFDKGKGRGAGDVRVAPADGGDAWCGRLIAEVVGELLGELGEIATALETPTGLKTLSSTLLPSLTATLPSFDYSGRSTPTDNPSPAHGPSLDALNGVGGGMGITLKRALTPGGRPTSIQAKVPPINTSISPEPRPASSNPFRRSTAITSPFNRTSSSASITTNSSAGGAQSPVVAQRYTSAPLSGVAGGRLMKLLGDFHLLIGQYNDAIKCYDDGAERCRVASDVLWEGVAREGRAIAGLGEAWETRDGSDRVQSFSSSPIAVEILAHYLSALSCTSKAPLPFPPTILSPSPQAISGSLAIPAPSAPGSVHLGTGEGLLAYLYTSLCLRIAHFQLIIWAAGGWGSIALSALMGHSLPRTFPLPLDAQDIYARQRRHRFLALLSSRSGLTRSSVFAHAEGAVGPHHRSMTRPEQLAVHVELVWLARWLDLPRHEAMLARDAVKKVGAMIVEGREETRRMAKAGFGKRDGDVDPASVGLGLGMPVASSRVAIRRKESTAGNDAVMALVERVFGVLGVDLLPGLEEDPENAVDSTLTPFGWPELQVESVQTAITVAEGMADHATVARLCLSALKSLTAYLNPSSQAHLIKLAPAALGVLKRRGIWDGGVGWWVPGKFVLSLEVASLSPNRLPIEHAASEIAVEGDKEFFLHNPRVKAAEAGKTVLVANEQVDVFVTLSNPFAFDLDIADLSLITSGTSFLANPLPLLLPAKSIQTIRITGTCPSEGTLHIQGVSVRLPDGAHADMYMPVVDAKARERKDKRMSRIQGDAAKMKRSGVEARLRNVKDDVKRGAGKDTLGEGEKWIECKVVHEQPLLWVKKSNLTHGTVMLYDGERTTIRLTLENSSSTPVNFVKLTFDDNTIREAQTILSEELGPRDVYEIEWDQKERPVMSWQPREVNVPPGGRTVLVIDCLGKVGCSDGSIRIDYGHVLSTDGSFYTRAITFPVLFTVYHTLEPHDLDIFRFSPRDRGPDRANAQRPSLAQRSSSFAHSMRQDQLRAALEDEADDEHCLLAISVRNVYGVPFEVCLSRLASSGENEIQATRLVPPGATERLIMPLPRISLSPRELNMPIPILGTRQYVVDKTGRSITELRRERELFWVRQRLLSMVSLTYLEPGTKREGEMNLRRVAVGRGVVDVLKKDEVEVRLLVERGDGDTWAVGSFVRVILEVTNRLDHPLAPLVRIDAIPTTSSVHPLDRSRQSLAPPPVQVAKHVVFDGTQSTSLSSIPPGEVGRHVVLVSFLAEGIFAFRGAVQGDVECGAGVDLGDRGRSELEGRREREEKEGRINHVESKLWFSDLSTVRVGRA